MLSVKAAAGRAGVSEGLVRRWVADGSLPHYRLGAKGKRGKIAIAEADLDALLATLKVAGQGGCPRPRPAKPIRLKHLRMPS